MVLCYDDQMNPQTIRSNDPRLPTSRKLVRTFCNRDLQVYIPTNVDPLPSLVPPRSTSMWWVEQRTKINAFCLFIYEQIRQDRYTWNPPKLENTHLTEPT